MSDNKPKASNSPVGEATSTALGSQEQPLATEIVPDDDLAAQNEDNDVAGGDDSSTEATASLSSSVLAYRTIQGRTYHSERGNAHYWASNDDLQNQSMDINHHLLTLALDGKLNLAPIEKNIEKALDIGTGTGIWAIDFADEHPTCKVIGTDISMIQPGWVPPNLEFLIDDCTQEWTFEPDSIDFVHMRYLTGSMPDWYALFKSAFTCCKPGGFVESFEGSPWLESDDGTVLESSALATWGKLFVNGGEKIGRTFTVIDEQLQRKGMETAGFVDIQEFTRKLPLGSWPKDPKLKEIGRFAQAALEKDIEGYVLYVANLQGWSKEELAAYYERFYREMRDNRIHSYFRIKVVWARKPNA